MSKGNLSEKIDNILIKKHPVRFQVNIDNPQGKSYLHEEVDVILKNRIFNESLGKELDLTEKSFAKISNSTLKEYVESKGNSYTTRNQTIQLLFESGKVNQNLIFFLEDKQERDSQEDEISEILESFDDSVEDEFETKYGEDIDFRDIGEKKSFDIESYVYDKLNNMDKDDWSNYVNILKDNGVQCYYDSISDTFIVKKKEDEESEERFEIDKEDSNVIGEIVKDSEYNLLGIRGLPKSSQKEYVIETIVEKNGYKTIVEYHDTQLKKPWKVGNAQFQFLQEALNSITIPYKELLKEQKIEIKKPTLLKEIIKQNYNKTDNLPLAEAQRRESASKKLISKIDKLHNSDFIIENLKEGVNIKTKQGNGEIRHIDWLYGTVNINTKKDSNGCNNFISNVSFDDITGLID